MYKSVRVIIFSIFFNTVAYFHSIYATDNQLPRLNLGFCETEKDLSLNQTEEHGPQNTQENLNDEHNESLQMDPAAHEDLMALLNAMAALQANPDGQNGLNDIYTQLMGGINQIAHKREEMLKKLPSCLQEAMKDVEQDYHDVLSNMHLRTTIISLCKEIAGLHDQELCLEVFSENLKHVVHDCLKEIGEVREQIANQSPLFDQFIEHLFKHKNQELLFLVSPATVAPKTYQSVQQQIEQEPAVFDSEALQKVCFSIKPLLEEKDKLSKELVFRLEFLHGIFTSLITKDVQSLMSWFMAYQTANVSLLNKKVDSAFELLVQAKKEHNQYGQDSDEKSDLSPQGEGFVDKILNGLIGGFEDNSVLYETNDPIHFALIELENIKKTLTVFEVLKKNLDVKDKSSLPTFFALLTVAYKVMAHFIDVYHMDLYGLTAKGCLNTVHPKNTLTFFDARKVLPMLLKYAFTTTFAAWKFFNVKSALHNATLFDVVLGKQPLDSVQPLLLMVKSYMAIPLILPTLLGNPAVGQYLSPIMVSGGRVALTWFYYHVFYRKLFDRNAFINDGGIADPLAVDGAGNVIEDPNSWMPAYYKPFKHSVAALSYDSARFISDLLQLTIYKKVDPAIMSKISTWSLGIIKPEALEIVVQSVVPWLLLRAPTIAAFSERDLGLALHHRNKKGMSALGVHVEEQIFCYIVGSIAGVGGTFLGRAYKHSIVKLIDTLIQKSLRGFAYVGIFDKEMVQLYESSKSDLIAEVRGIVSMIKFPLYALLTADVKESQTYSAFVIPLLIEHGYLAKDDLEPMHVRQAFLYFILNGCARLKILSHYEAAFYANQVSKNPFLLDNMVDKIIDNAAANLVGNFIGLATTSIFYVAASAVHREWGPFYPDIKQGLNRAFA